jgi:hypothetical protein
MASERLIDPNDPEFQLGRYLYDAQVLYADAQEGPVDAERVKEVCERYCRLINLVGQLRAECDRLEENTKYAGTVLHVLGTNIRDGMKKLGMGG